MTNTFFSEETLRKKKMAILFCGVIMYFFTNMSKVLIPGTVFNELQSAGLDVKSISALGAFYMYAYAGSQLLTGIFSDRYGGVRILLIGGSMFTAGTIGFPFMENIYLMYFSVCSQVSEREQSFSAWQNCWQTFFLPNLLLLWE